MIRITYLLPFCLFWVLFVLSCQTSPQETTKQDSTATSSKPSPEAQDIPTIVFFGNSLTAGFGVEPTQAFPALIQQKIDSMGKKYQVVNAGLSGETTAAGNARLDWLLKKQKIDIFILELGANDGLRGISLQETRKNLAEMIQKLQKHNPKMRILLSGMKIPPNMSQAYTQEFQSIFPTLAQEYNLTLIPFLLDKVGGEPALNLPDGIHPNPDGHKIIAQNVWQILAPIL